MTTRSYKSGSVVYVEGDRALEIYIVRSGVILLTHTDTIEKKDKEEIIKKNHFFGILSVLGGHIRQDTARVIQDCELLVLSEQEFEKVASKNTTVIIQMLQSFSGRLRREHKALQKILGENDESENLGEKLFKMGLYFYQTHQLKYAKHAFTSYLKNFKEPQNSETSKKVQTAMKYIDSNTPYDVFETKI